MVADERDFQAMRDIADGLLVGSDGESIGRVSDVIIAVDKHGVYRCTTLMLGPEALAGRLGPRLRSWLHRWLNGRYEAAIDIGEVGEFGPTLKLRQPAESYEAGRVDEWLVDHILRFIPGNGRPR